jgi:hypothetical protein
LGFGALPPRGVLRKNVILQMLQTRVV